MIGGKNRGRLHDLSDRKVTHTGAGTATAKPLSILIGGHMTEVSTAKKRGSQDAISLSVFGGKRRGRSFLTSKTGNWKQTTRIVNQNSRISHELLINSDKTLQRVFLTKEGLRTGDNNHLNLLEVRSVKKHSSLQFSTRKKTRVRVPPD